MIMMTTENILWITVAFGVVMIVQLIIFLYIQAHITAGTLFIKAQEIMNGAIRDWIKAHG